MPMVMRLGNNIRLQLVHHRSYNANANTVHYIAGHNSITHCTRATVTYQFKQGSVQVQRSGHSGSFLHR